MKRQKATVSSSRRGRYKWPLIPKHVRSTLLISSRATLEAEGRFATYEGHLLPEHREVLRYAIAGTWLPFALALAHYSACEALALTVVEQVNIGRKTGERINGTLLGTIARLARSAGVAPWALVEQVPRFWARAFDGGEVTFEKLGPKEARIKVLEQPLMRFGYFRYGLAGTAAAQLMSFTSHAYVRVDRFDPKTLVTSYLYQWA